MRKSLLWAALPIVVIIVSVVMVVAQEGTRNVAIILDASGSMQAALSGTTRIDVARESVISTVGQLPDETNVSLWAYGHRLPQDDPAASCTDIEQITPFVPVDDDAAFASIVRDIDAIGYTPISDTLQQAAATFGQTGINTIVLISDGEETCAGDPCAVARDLKANNVDLVVNTVGFAADAETRAQLQCIAQVTGGVYYDAQDADALTNALQSAAVTPTGDVRIVDPSGDPLPDVPFTLTSSETPDEITNFVGQANVPVGTYEAQARGAELVTVTIVVNADETTDIVVNPEPVGQIQLFDMEGNPLEDLRFDLSLSDGTYIGAFFSGSTVPTGDYNVNIATIIPFSTTATVLLGEVTEIVVDTSTGTIRLVDEETGAVLEDPRFEVTEADEDGRYLSRHSGTFDVPPGEYRVLVRWIIPFETIVTVSNGENTDIPLNTELGTIRVVDETTGEVLESPQFEVTQAGDGGRYLSRHSGTFDVPPGTYDVLIRSTIRQEVQVTVVAGETVDIPLSTEEGTIRLVDEATGEVLEDPQFEVTEAEEGGQYLSRHSGTFDVPPGEYRVLVRWIIPFETIVTVGSGETVDIPLDTEVGTIRLVDEATGAVLEAPQFEVREAEEGGQYLSRHSGTFDVPPGEYRVLVRWIIPFETTVTVNSDVSTDIVLDTAVGTIELTDGNAVITDPQFEVTETIEDGRYLSRHSGSFDVPPGEYLVRVRDGNGIEAFEIVVTVTAGQTTRIDAVNQTVLP